jgi:hypothetical protein
MALAAQRFEVLVVIAAAVGVLDDASTATEGSAPAERSITSSREVTAATMGSTA